MHTVRFSESNLSFCIFTESKLDAVEFRGCNITEGSLSECKLKKTAFKNCNFNGCSFFGTKLEGIDMRENSMAGIIFSDSLFELRGAVISGEQAEIVARMMGIKVK